MAESSFSIASTFVLKPSSAAIISLVAGEYLLRLVYGTAFTSAPESASHAISTIAIKFAGLLFVVSTSLLQAWSSRAGLRTQVALTAFKVSRGLPSLNSLSAALLSHPSAPLQVFAIVGVSIGGIIRLSRGNPASPFNFDDSSDRDETSYALAIFLSLWFFDGWDTLSYLTRD